MARPRVSGSSSSMTIISVWAKVENTAIAVPAFARGQIAQPSQRRVSLPSLSLLADLFDLSVI